MKCTIKGCPGKYEQRNIVHTLNHHGAVIVIENVPAETCSLCGDVLLSPETVEHIEGLLKQRPQSKKTAPVYEFA